MGKSSSAPEAPNPYAVANAQSGLNSQTARLGATLNRPNVISPFGSQTWSNVGDQWTNQINLSPQQQGIFDTQQGIQQNLGNQAAQSTAAPFSLSGAMDTLSSVTEPQYQRDQDALNARLINSGFRQGSEG